MARRVLKRDDRLAGNAMARIISLGQSRRFHPPAGWRAALVLRLARHDLGKSRWELAADLGRLFAYPVMEGTIEAWEAARPPPPTDVVDTVLNLTGGDLDALFQRVRLEELDREPNVAPMIEPDHESMGGAQNMPMVGRFAGSIDPEGRQRLQSAIDGRSAPDLLVAASLESILGYLRTQDDLVGPQRMLPVARWFVDSIDDLVRDASLPTHRALLSVAAQYEQFIGWLWVDIGDQEQAGRSYDGAIIRAVESGNRTLAGYLLACKSEQALTAGQAEKAARLAREARGRAWAMSAVPMAWASDLEARALAVLGRTEQCNRRLDRSAELLARRKDEPPWVYHYVEKVLEVHTGMCLTDLANTDFRHARRATEIFDHAIAGVAPARVRDRAYYLTCAAQAHARGREPERAAEVALEATRLAIETNSTRVLRNLRSLHRELNDFRDLQQVQEFRALLDTAPPG